MDLLTTKEACEISGYHPDHIRELLREDKINGRKFGPVWQIDKKSLLTYMKKMEDLGKRRGPKSVDE